MNAELIPRTWSVTLVAVLLAGLGGSRQISVYQRPEQTVFNSEEVPSEVFVRKPVPIPKPVLQVLSENLNPGTVYCIKHQTQLTPKQIPAAWFIGSEIHLDGIGEVGLVVLPNVPKILQHDSPADVRAGGCLFGAHGGPFWVFRQKDGKYELLLATFADGLGVLSSRTNGYRDIEADYTTAVANATGHEVIYKFDGRRYQISERKPLH